MSGPLETSVTLEEVFGVVNAKRVPLAPELAGYLALEIAEGADAAGGDIDPRFVFIGEEGTVGLVRPKRDGAIGSAEGSVRTLLARLLDASGSQTPALGTASKRRAGSGLPSLVEELEAALIPVNRAAGRRALARLAREVKRVTLGVGRNASIPSEQPPPRRGSSPSYSSVPSEPRPTPAPVHSPEPEQNERPAPRPSVRPPTPPAAFPHEEERTSARGSIPAEIYAPTQPLSEPDSAVPTARAPVHDASDLPTIEFTPAQAKARDSVDSLIASFGVSSKTDQQVSRELKAMVGIDATAPPPRVAGRDSQVDALMALTEESAPAPRARDASSPDRAEVPPPPSSRPARKKSTPDEPPRARDASRDPPAPPTRGPQISYSDDRQLPTGPSQLRVRTSSSDLMKPRRSGVLIIVALIALGLGALIIWRMKPGMFSGRTQERIDAEKAQVEAERQRQLAAAQTNACRATLVVTDVPPHAEVLKLVGQAPADVGRMPVGTRLEFVATAEGYAPKRTVLATGAVWDTGADGKPRIELPVQLEKSKGKAGQIDLWPAGEPGSEAGGNGPPGTVHVVSSPKGAEVWLLAGFGPEASIAQLPCDVDVDVLIAGPTTLRKRMHVASTDFKEGGDVKGGRAARVSAK
jgi:hypothetical protein